MAMFAIEMNDGTTAIMQTFNGATVDQCLAKWHPAERAKVTSRRPITLPEATAIRAKRPRPIPLAQANGP